MIGEYGANEIITTTTTYFARSPENFCGFFSSNLPGDFALKNGGDFW